METKTLIISAFPACGKSYMTHHSNGKNYLDSDSSEFSWVINESGEKVRNPDFPNNYITHIKDNIGKTDVIFVSSHETVRKALRENNIPYILVYPSPTENNRGVWIQRMRDRGSSDELISVVYNNWYNWLEDIMIETYPIHYVLDGDIKGNGFYLDEKAIENIKEAVNF